MQTIEILTYKINYKSSRAVKNDIRVFKMFKSFYKWFCYCMYDWLKILICLLFYSFLSRIHVIILKSEFQECRNVSVYTVQTYSHILSVTLCIPYVSDWYLRGLCCSSIWLEIFKLFNNPIRVLTQNQNTELWFVFLLKLSKWSLDICLKREKKRSAFYSSGKMKERNW